MSLEEIGRRLAGLLAVDAVRLGWRFRGLTHTITAEGEQQWSVIVVGPIDIHVRHPVYIGPREGEGDILMVSSGELGTLDSATPEGLIRLADQWAIGIGIKG